MSRNGITYLDVARCADEFAARHEDPTIERIRIKLATGSNSTIGTHLRTWRSKQDALQQLISKENIPEELIILLKGLWERVVATAETQIEAIKKDTQHDLTERQQTIQQLNQENARLSQSEAQLKKTCDGLKHEKTILEKIMADAKIEIATLQTQCQGVTQQLADKKNRIDELHRQNKQTQANLEHYQASQLVQRQQDQQRAEVRENELTQRVQNITLENNSLRQEKVGLQNAHDQILAAHNNLQTQLEKTLQHDEKITSELTALQAEYAKKAVSEHHWKTQHDNISVKWEEQMRLSADLRTQNSVFSQKLTAMKMDVDYHSEQSKMLANEKWIIGQEKAQLLGQIRQLQVAL